MKKILLILGITVLAFVGLEIFQTIKDNDSVRKAGSPISQSVKIGEVVYNIEIADSDEERFKGLSGRESLPSNQGLLFWFERKDLHAFWMKDMLIPIDIIWIDEDTIVDIHENVPVPLGNYYPKYQPRVSVDKVLETNAGQVKENNITIGQKVEFTLIKPESSASQ